MLLASLASRFAPSVDRRTALRRCTSLLRRLNPLSSTTSPTGLRRRSLASCSAGGAHGVPPELGVTASFRCVGSPKSRDDELVVLGSFGLRPDDVGPGVGFGRVGVPQPGEFAHDPVADRHRIRVAGVLERAQLRLASHSGPPPPSGNRRNTHPMAYIARHTIGRRRPRGWGRRSSRPRPKVTLPATNRAYLAERCPSAVVTRCSRAARSRHARCRRTASPAGRSSSCASQRCETTGRIGFGWRKTR